MARRHNGSRCHRPDCLPEVIGASRQSGQLSVYDERRDNTWNPTDQSKDGRNKDRAAAFIQNSQGREDDTNDCTPNAHVLSSQCNLIHTIIITFRHQKSCQALKSAQEF